MSIKSRLLGAASTESIDSRAQGAVAGQLADGEEIVAGTVAIGDGAAPALLPKSWGDHLYFLVLTNRRLLLIKQNASGEAEEGNALAADRHDVKVENYSDNFTGGWQMTFEELGARWHIHSPSDRKNAKAIAEALGWGNYQLLGPAGSRA